VHLIPLSEMKHATFQHKENLLPAEFEEIAEKIRSAMK